MASITAGQIHDLLVGTRVMVDAGEAATRARDSLGVVLRSVMIEAGTGLRELSAVTGLHHATVAAMIRRAAGPELPDGWDQPELPISRAMDVGVPITRIRSAGVSSPVEAAAQTQTNTPNRGRGR